MLRSFDDLGTPLHQVTFCVVDLETTGGSAAACEITEVGAARFRGGERLGTFQTVVRPQGPLDPCISARTGITEDMVRQAPTVAAVLPTLAEFVGGSVLVGHNLRFDVSFLDAALAADARSPVGLRTVDTVALARRLVRDEVTDCRLGTLAHHFGLPHRPTHRALDDVLATADLLHVLLERATSFGVTVLDDLLQLPRLAAHPQAGKLRLTNRLPRSPGVYVLRDGQGRPLHVGHADDDLRRRVRWLFAGDDRRLTGPLLREVHAIDHLTCAPAPAPEVAAIRLVQALQPRRAPQLAAVSGYRYVKLGARGTGRLTVARTIGAGSGRYLGPLPSAVAARAVVDAVDVVCEAGADAAADEALGPVDLFDRPAAVVSRLRQRADEATDDRRYGQATALHAMAVAVADAVTSQQRVDALRRSERVVVALGDHHVELVRGRLAHTGADGAAPAALDLAEGPPDDGPLPPELADELWCIAAWLDRHADELRLVAVDGELSCPLPRLPRLVCATC